MVCGFVEIGWLNVVCVVSGFDSWFDLVDNDVCMLIVE